MEELPKIAQTAMAQTADRFRRKTKPFGDVFICGFGISEKKRPDQLAASLGKFLKHFPQQLFAFRAEINLERVGAWIRQAESVVLWIVAAAQIFGANEVIALADRDSQDPRTKPGGVDQRMEVLENTTADGLKDLM